MDEACTESDVSFSPSQILERLQVLRRIQLMQRGKLQKHSLQFKETPETSSSVTEIVSHFTSSTSYNTFRNLLESVNDISNQVSPRLNASGTLSQNVQERDLIDGVSLLNLSQESEFVASPPISSRSGDSTSSKGLDTSREGRKPQSSQNRMIGRSITASSHKNNMRELTKERLSVDEMPILSPKKDFEQMLLEKLKNDNSVHNNKTEPTRTSNDNCNKKSFLKKGEGIARFRLKKNAIVIQNTKSLPWKKKVFQKSNTQSPLKQSIKKMKNEVRNPLNTLKLQPLISDFKVPTITKKKVPDQLEKELQQQIQHSENCELKSSDNCSDHPHVANESILNRHTENISIAAHGISLLKSKHPLSTNKGKTWASVLTKEQSDFLRQLKQSDYYKNFTSPTKSVVSDVSCDETMCKLKQDRELAEQNLFDLLENKVNHDSFSLENSFFNRLLKKSNLECSGESTPLVLQKCLSNNPGLLHIFPGLKHKKQSEDTHSDTETCCSNYTDCCSNNTCSSESCCSCNTVEQTQKSEQNLSNFPLRKSTDKICKKENINQNEVDNNEKQDQRTEVTEDVSKTNIAEMNAKLIATSELLKDRLNELEDEIETFKKENANLAKLRSEFDQDKQKFYEDKAVFEQKMNEEKVLNEYYLAEEKDKLSKQKQLYDRHVREMRGRLNKKDKDQVVNFKKEISDLKEEIRIKDVKSTSTIARLRNQIKIMEKEKKELLDEVEKLKKENRRILHSNEVTRRLTNIKYLAEISKKLNNISSKDTRPDIHTDRDIKYKSYEIEKQCRSRNIKPAKENIRPLQRAKSVPNLNVTSRYAKYFSQRDTFSELDQNNLINIERKSNDNDNLDDSDTVSNKSLEKDYASSENEDYLEKLYVERFKTNSPKSNISNGSNSNAENNFAEKQHLNENTKDFFIQKPVRKSTSPKRLSPSETTVNRNKSPISILSNKSGITQSSNSADYILNYLNSNNSVKRSKSPLSALNHSSLRTATVVHNNQYENKLMTISPEPAVSKTSLTKTNLNPTELRKADGSRELRFPNGNVKYISGDGKYSKFVYYNGDVKENFYNEGRIKYFYAETKTYHTTHADGLEVLEFSDGQVEKRYKDGSSEIRLPNGSVRYFDPKNKHVREEWRFPDGAALTVAANGDRRIVLPNGQVEVHAQDHKRREFPDGTVKLVYNDGTSETRYASGRVRIKDKHGNLIIDSAPG